MHKILEGSVFYRLIAAVCAWFGAQWKKSRIIGAFLSEGKGQAVSENSIFSKIWRFIHNLMCTVFEKLRLTKLFEGSVFKQFYFWCILTAVLAPIIPTMAVFALSAVAVFSFAVKFSCDRERKLSYAPINKYILIFAFIYFIATFTSVTVSGSLLGGMLTVFFILFSLAYENSIESQKQLDISIYLFVGAGVAVSLYGIFQYVFGFTGAEAWLDSDMFSEIQLRVYSTLQNPNVLSEYLLLIIPLSFACVITGKTAGKKALALGAFAIMCLCMVLTFSRGGWLGLLFAAAVFLVLLDRRFILLGIVGLVALYFVLPDTIIDRFASIGDMKDTSTSYRVYIWLATINMLKDYWMCGIGPGTDAYNMVYPAYGYHDVIAPHSHNLFLQIMCDTGICGLIIFLVILFVFFKMMCGSLSREKDKVSRIYQISTISAMCGFLVQSMTDYSFYNYRVMLMFWVFVAMSAAISKRSQLDGGRL